MRVKRTKLDPENVHLLVYCKDNLPRVAINKWQYTDILEESNEEEMPVNEDSAEVLLLN